MTVANNESAGPGRAEKSEERSERGVSVTKTGRREEGKAKGEEGTRT